MTSDTQQPRLIKTLLAVSGWISILALIVMTAIIGWQVFGRFVLNDTPKWTEQLAGVLMVYLTMFGAAACVYDDGLIALDVFRNGMRDSTQLLLKLGCELLIFIFAAVLLVYGVKMAALVTDWFIPTLGVPRTVMYAAFPFAGALMLVFSGLRIKRFFSLVRNSQP